MVCPNCHRMNLAARDIFCPWCGRKLATFELALNPPFVYAGGIALPVELRIRNTGVAGALQVLAIESSQHWLHAPSRKIQPIMRGETGVLDLEVDSWQLLEADYHEAVLKVITNAGDDSIRFSAVPEPRPEDIEQVAGEFEIFLDNQKTEHNVCAIRLSRGLVTVKDLSTDVPWAKIRLPEGLSLPFVLDSRHTPELCFDLDANEEDFIRRNQAPPTTYEGNVLVRYAEFDRQRNIPFRFVCYKAPELYLVQENETRVSVFAARPARLPLTIWNGRPEDSKRGVDRATLRVSNFEVSDVLGQACDWVKLPESLDLPWDISGGSVREITLGILTTEETPEPAGHRGIGNHRIEIKIHSNVPLSPVRTFFFDIVVGQMPVYDGVVAIDYGTSATCVAALSVQGELQVIPVDETLETQRDAELGRGTTAPSAIAYFDLIEGGGKQYQIGSLPASEMHLREFAESIVTSAKRYLGSSHLFSVAFRQHRNLRAEYHAREVVTDYLRRIREILEGHLGARIGRCIITHPSRFSLQQIADLREAAKTSFGEQCDIEHLPEAVAAALDMIVSEELCCLPEYNLAVYDFGGGTTDITILNITNTRTNGVLITSLSVLGADGHPRAGGDDVTQIVLELGYGHCQEVFKARHTDVSSFDIPIEPESYKSSPVARHKAEQNRKALYGWADMTKILLSKFGDRHSVPSHRANLDLYVSSGDSELDSSFPHQEIVPSAERFESRVRDWLERQGPIVKMKTLAATRGLSRVDFVLLAGKSSLLPFVEAMVSTHFPDAKILRPADMKECVVRGACIIEKYRDVGVHQLVVNKGKTATVSRLGCREVVHNEFRFVEIVPAGEPIPEGGLRHDIPVPNGPNRRHRIALLENTGVENLCFANGKKNPNIISHGWVDLSQIPPDVSEEDLRRGRVELEISPNLGLTLRAYVPSGSDGVERVIPLIQVTSEEMLARG